MVTTLDSGFERIGPRDLIIHRLARLTICTGDDEWKLQDGCGAGFGFVTGCGYGQGYCNPPYGDGLGMGEVCYGFIKGGGRAAGHHLGSDDGDGFADGTDMGDGLGGSSPEL